MIVQSISDHVSFIHSALGQYVPSSSWKDVAVVCPFCKEREGERYSKKKLVIRLADDVTHCWVCGFSSNSLLPILKKFARSHVQEYLSDHAPQNLKFKLDDANIDDQRPVLPSDFRLLAASDPHETRRHMKYLFKRDVDIDDIWYYKLGYSHEHGLRDRVIFPSFSNDGDLNFYQARSATGATPTYVSPKLDRKSIIFNEILIDWSKPVVLCEGPFDMVKCGRNSVPLLGKFISVNSKLFSTIVTNAHDIVVALDDDAREQCMDACKKLMAYDVSVRFVRMPAMSDPGSLSKSTMKSLIDGASEYDWTTHIHDKIMAATSCSMGI